MYYIKTNGTYYFIPGGARDGQYQVRCYASIGHCRVNFHNWDGSNHSIAAGDYKKLKIVIIKSNTSSKGGSQTKQQKVINKLEAAGVNVKDYNTVCDYYGIAKK